MNIASNSRQNASLHGGDEEDLKDRFRVLVADDHQLFREGFSRILKALHPSTTVDEAACFDEAYAMCGGNAPFDLVLLDLRMPGMSPEAIGRIRAPAGNAPVVIVSSHDDRPNIVRSLKAGASGYIPKTMSSDLLIRALQLVLSGGIYIPQAILDGELEKPAQAPLMARISGKDGVRFSRRQTEVLQLMARGKSNKEMARELGISLHTVKIHVGVVTKALAATNRTQAVMNAVHKGLLEHPAAPSGQRGSPPTP